MEPILCHVWIRFGSWAIREWVELSYNFEGWRFPLPNMAWCGPFRPDRLRLNFSLYLGNGIQLLGNATLSSYSVNLDGSDLPLDGTTPMSPSKPDGVLIEIGGLKDDKHTITLTAHIPQTQTPRNSSMLVFDKAIIRTGLGNAAIK